MKVTPEEEDLVTELLALEYEKESLNYPFTPPAFDGPAALWGAQTVYSASQLLLYRENQAEELSFLLPAYSNTLTPEAVLSIDLCLRFLPPLLEQASSIDNQDALISVLEQHLQQWHYSAVGYDLALENLSFETVLSDNCLLQLYADRVIQRKSRRLAEHAPIQTQIKASLGHYASTFWSALS
ncbi:hypothetical protein [Rufibacter hautae]|uniref:MoxR-vWA-beta-propeller ternary system domain-containing protein n=1 Tax=Rufibacter hautae TaxID=2595005 RepID=A0A5B6TJ70_9BACT|nr:hypothetical protein [Rufibacter hautae]KAA3440712.1 hypothetical protein FOA19_08705 [Rufibacter hautae]